MEDPRASRSQAVPLWTGVVVVLALVLGVPGALRNFRAVERLPDPSTVGLPEPIEPEGELEEPPRVFRWTPGGEDVDFAQVVIYRASYERIWESPPLTEAHFELDPDQAFLGIPPWEECAWKVREVVAGRPRASSRLAMFQFRKDHRGLEAGEALPESRFIIE